MDILHPPTGDYNQQIVHYRHQQAHQQARHSQQQQHEQQVLAQEKALQRYSQLRQQQQHLQQGSGAAQEEVDEDEDGDDEVLLMAEPQGQSQERSSARQGRQRLGKRSARTEQAKELASFEVTDWYGLRAPSSGDPVGPCVSL